MRRLPTRLKGLVLIEPDVHADERGFFLETFRLDAFADLGIGVPFVQDNHSRSLRGTVRGLHLQAAPGQAKLVRCARGAIRDVAVDVRPSSPTFGEHEWFDLDDRAHRQLFIPVGFAHGFRVDSHEADVMYRVSAYYDPSLELGIAWDDPALGIDWGEGPHLISDRDRANPPLAALRGRAATVVAPDDAPRRGVH